MGVLLLPVAVWAIDQTFGDVPPSDWAYEDVEWLARVGLTNGCGDGSDYCPDDNVTRREIAAFTHRVNDELIPTVFATKDLTEHDDLSALDGDVKLFTQTFVATADSVVTANVSFGAVYQDLSEGSPQGYTDVYSWVQLDDTTCVEPPFGSRTTVAPENVEPLSVAAAFTDVTEVAEGVHTVTLCVSIEGDGADIEVATLSGIVSPHPRSELNVILPPIILDAPDADRSR